MATGNPEFTVSIGADLSGLTADFEQIGPIVESATANLSASMAPLAAGTAGASGAFRSFSDALLALARAQSDQVVAITKLSGALASLGTAANQSVAPLSAETGALGALGSALASTSTASMQTGTALAAAGRASGEAGTALGQVGQKATASLAQTATAAANSAKAVESLGAAAGGIATASATATKGLRANMEGVGEAVKSANEPLATVQTSLAGLAAETNELASEEAPLAPLASSAKDAWAELDKLKEELGLSKKAVRDLGQQEIEFPPDLAEAPDTLGQLSLGYEQVAEAAEQVPPPVDDANKALDETAPAADRAGRGLGGLLGWMRQHRSEQVQQSRMSRFFANELLSFLPAAAQAKQGLSGLIGVFIQGAAGGLGFGLALEAVKVAINVVSEAMTRSSKAAQEMRAELRSAMTDIAFSARDLRESFGPTLSKTEQLIREKTTAYAKQIAEAQEKIDKANDQSKWKKFWDRWTPGDDHVQLAERETKRIQQLTDLSANLSKNTNIQDTARTEAIKAAEQYGRDTLTLESQRGSALVRMRRELQDKLFAFDKALPNQWAQIRRQMEGYAKMGIVVPITMDWSEAEKILRNGPLSGMTKVDFQVNWEALQAAMKQRAEIEKKGGVEITNEAKAQSLAFEQARLKHLQAFATERHRIELQGLSEVKALEEEKRKAEAAGDKENAKRAAARITWAKQETAEKLRQFDRQLTLQIRLAELGHEKTYTDPYSAIEVERLEKRASLQSELTEELRKTKNVENERTRLLREQMGWANEDAAQKTRALEVQEALTVRVAEAQHEAAMEQAAEATRAARATVDASLAGTAADLTRIQIERDGSQEILQLQAKIDADRGKMTEVDIRRTRQRMDEVRLETQARLLAHDAQKKAAADALQSADFKSAVADQIAAINAQRDAEVGRLNAWAATRVGAEEELAKRIREVNERADVEIWRTKHAYAASFIDNLSQTWTAGLARVFEGTLSFKDAITGIWGTIRSAFAQTAASMVMDWMKAQAQKLIVTKATAIQEVAIESWAAIKKAAVWIASGIKDITIKAYRAAAGAYSAISDIPFVGPFLAPAVAAATLAAVIGLGSKIASAAGGYDIPKGVNPLVQAHSEEMVLPSKYATPLRKMLEAGGPEAGGGEAMPPINVNLSGVDGPSIMRLMRSNEGKSALSTALAEAIRDGRIKRV